MRVLLFLALMAGAYAEAKVKVDFGPGGITIGEPGGPGITINPGWGKGPGKKPGKPGFGKPGPGFDKEGMMILQNRPDEILFGRVFLETRNDTDTIYNMPRCAKSANERVSFVQLRFNTAPTRIDRVVLTYQNGQREQLNLRPNHDQGTATRWIPLNGWNDRCIRDIQISGQSYGYDRAMVSIVGSR